VDGDGNSAWSRRYRDLILGHINDLGGEAALSQSQISLIRRASAIELELEQMEGRLSEGGTVDIEKFSRAASHLRRLLESLGLERRARDITPSLQQYLASRPVEPIEESADEARSFTPDPERAPATSLRTRRGK
jgi:hypothetical protein